MAESPGVPPPDCISQVLRGGNISGHFGDKQSSGNVAADFHCSRCLLHVRWRNAPRLLGACGCLPLVSAVRVMICHGVQRKRACPVASRPHTRPPPLHSIDNRQQLQQLWHIMWWWVSTLSDVAGQAAQCTARGVAQCWRATWGGPCRIGGTCRMGWG